ncbi:ATP-binding protein [Streptomyces sp. NRRL F-5135]|uniref:ATP-binding protein n=1 Tax=Streptomyces sp. NRRL F-5135 TaxID=1463858 RepID=UPI0004C9BABD
MAKAAVAYASAVVFVRADRSRSRGSGGTGLGLSIVLAVVTAHGGTAEVTSRPGHTEFTLDFPVLRPDGPDADG